MPKGIGLEDLRALLTEDKLSIHVAIITKLQMASDRSVMRVTVNLFPEQISMVARMTWEAVGPNAGFFQIPSVNDLVLIAFAEGHEDEAYVIRRLTSKEDTIPGKAITGDIVMQALTGKKAHILSNTAVLLGRGGADPTQPLVLGTVFKTAYSKDLDETAKHKHIDSLGYLTSVPDNVTEFVTLKASPVDDLAMLSDLSKTEK